MINPVNSPPDHITVTVQLHNNDYLILMPIILCTLVSLRIYYA